MLREIFEKQVMSGKKPLLDEVTQVVIDSVGEKLEKRDKVTALNLEYQGKTFRVVSVEEHLEGKPCKILVKDIHGNKLSFWNHRLKKVMEAKKKRSQVLERVQIKERKWLYTVDLSFMHDYDDIDNSSDPIAEYPERWKELIKKTTDALKVTSKKMRAENQISLADDIDELSKNFEGALNGDEYNDYLNELFDLGDAESIWIDTFTKSKSQEEPPKAPTGESTEVIKGEFAVSDEMYDSLVKDLPELANLPKEELIRGAKHEYDEHLKSISGEGGVSDPILTSVKIAADHLKEIPEYYTMLDKLEADFKAAKEKPKSEEKPPEEQMQTTGSPTVGEMTDEAIIKEYQEMLKDKKFVQEHLEEVAPVGWEGTVKAMKSHPEIINPYALSYWMKGKGYKPHESAMESAASLSSLPKYDADSTIEELEDVYNKLEDMFPKLPETEKNKASDMLEEIKAFIDQRERDKELGEALEQDFHKWTKEERVWIEVDGQIYEVLGLYPDFVVAVPYKAGGKESYFDEEDYKRVEKPADAPEKPPMAECGMNEVVRKVGDKWQVQSHKGKNLGTYDTEGEAKKRLGQVEYFKHAKESVKLKESVTDVSDHDIAATIVKVFQKNPDADSFEQTADLISTFITDFHLTMTEFLEIRPRLQTALRAYTESPEYKTSKNKAAGPGPELPASPSGAVTPPEAGEEEIEEPLGDSIQVKDRIKFVKDESVIKTGAIGEVTLVSENSCTIDFGSGNQRSFKTIALKEWAVKLKKQKKITKPVKEDIQVTAETPDSVSFNIDGKRYEYFGLDAKKIETFKSMLSHGAKFNALHWLHKFVPKDKRFKVVGTGTEQKFEPLKEEETPGGSSEEIPTGDPREELMDALVAKGVPESDARIFALDIGIGIWPDKEGKMLKKYNINIPQSEVEELIKQFFGGEEYVEECNIYTPVAEDADPTRDLNKPEGVQEKPKAEINTANKFVVKVKEIGAEHEVERSHTKFEDAQKQAEKMKETPDKYEYIRICSYADDKLLQDVECYKQGTGAPAKDQKAVDAEVKVNPPAETGSPTDAPPIKEDLDPNAVKKTIADLEDQLSKATDDKIKADLVMKIQDLKKSINLQ